MGRIGKILVLGIGFSFLMPLLIILVYKSDLVPLAVVQNERSGRVVAKKSLFGFDLIQEELFYGNGKSDSEVWIEGVKVAFPYPLYLGNRFWAEKGKEKSVIALLKVYYEKRQAEFLVAFNDEEETLLLNWDEEIEISAEISIAWSPRDSNSVYILADGYPLKDPNDMYSVRFSKDGPLLKTPID